jgi:ssRNA-specific RNase YbeY (16S rRNA maturation enzyme)
VIEVETENRSGVAFPVDAARSFAVELLRGEGVEAGELGLWLVAGSEMRALKSEHLGIDEITDVLSFPIDAADAVPDGVPRALGDVFVCPQVVGDGWRAPLAHGLLHLLGYVHGEEMERREQELLR